jgi:ADP-ribosylglycohydrolase
MKTFFPLIALVFVPLFLTGCAATRPIGDIALGAGGAVLANELSHGNPAITAAGAAGGVLVSEGLHYASQKQSDKAYTTGYEKGRSDAVKQQYWILVNQQKEKAEQNQENVRYYQIPLPEQTIDGAILNPTTKLLRIEE